MELPIHFVVIAALAIIVMLGLLAAVTLGVDQAGGQIDDTVGQIGERIGCVFDNMADARSECPRDTSWKADPGETTHA